MLSKIKSPSLIERPSAQLGHANSNTNNTIDQSERPQSSEELDDNDDERQLEVEQTDGTDLIIEREPETEKKQNEPESERHLENEPDLSGAQRQAINDNNNNINENNNNLNNLNEDSNRSLMLQHRVALQQQQQQQQRTGKRSQNELIDIIEVSRKRRLSKDSADSLTSFIRWSFSHLDELATGRLGKVQSIRRPRQIKSERGGNDNDQEEARHEELDESENLTIDERAEDEDDDGEDDQSEMLRVVGAERSLRNRAGGRHATNEQQVEVELDEGPTELEEMAPIKRARSQSRSPEPRAKLLSGTSIDLSDVHSEGRKSNLFQQEANTNGNGHNQNHQRNIKSLDHIANQLSRVGQLNLSNSGGGDELAEDRRSSNGLALQLQQFLQQQQQQQQHNSVLDELMLNPDGATSPGGGQPQASQQQQIALAAAIHRALLGQGASNSTPGATTNGRSEMKPANGAGTQQHLAISPGGFIGDSLNRQQQQQRPRAYNTRGLAQAAANLASNRLQQQQLAISNRVAMIQQQQQHQQQQQRHAQAAAALSVLANGANPVALQHFAAAAAAAAASNQPRSGGGGGGGLPHHHQPSSGVSAAAAAAAAALQRQHQQQQQQQQQQRHQHQAAFQLPPAAGQPNAISLAALANQTEFKCDTCPSSFDDRHRLMQHQSIHLELKKDWFTETPVDEVMKIFNRRRGEFLCNLCNLRFEATLDYDQHNHQVHGPRPYCCQFCGNGTRTFKCWRQYLNHLYDHRYIFSCTIGDCDFTVNRRDSLRFHIFRFHLNCQLPQNQLVTPTNGLGQPNNTKFSPSAAQLSPYNLSQNGGGGGGFGRDVDSFHFGNLQAGPRKWSHLNDLDMDDVDEADEDTENEMNVAD